MRKSIFDLFFPYENLTINPEDLRTILGYQTRISRGQEPFQDSECGPVRTLQFHKVFKGEKEKFDYETPIASKSRTS